MDTIDLTNSDSDEEFRFAKRQRRSAPDDDEVQIVEKPVTPAPAVAGPEPALGDEDLLITRATGPIWNQDLPHSRTQCGKHPFVASKNVSNKEHCSKCFCFVCDVEADKCQHWGTGQSSQDHCNAHGGRSLFRDMHASAPRRAASPSALPSAGGAAGPSGYSVGGRLTATPTAARTPAHRAAAPLRLSLSLPALGPPAPSAGAGPSRQVNLAEGEDESDSDSDSGSDDSDGYDDGYWEDIGDDSRDPFRSGYLGQHAAAQTPAEMRPRKMAIQPLDPGTVLPDPAQNDRMLELGTINLAIKAKAPYNLADLRERLVPTGIASKENESARKDRVTISSLHWSDMLELLPLPLLQYGCERTPMRVRRVTIVHHDGRAKPLTVGVSVHKDARLSELLEAMKQHPAAACSPEEELVVGYCTGEAPNPLHTTTLLDASQETNEKHAKRGYVAYRVPRVNPGQSKRPRRVMVFNKKRDHEEYDNKYASYLDTAHTLLLDLPGDLWKGGHDESKTVARMVAGALAPYRKPGLPKPALNRCFSLHRCDTLGDAMDWGKKRFCQAATRSHQISESIENGVLFLAAHWKPCGLELYDTGSWSQPEVDPSASEQAMAETELLIEEDNKLEAARDERSHLPNLLVIDLADACRTFRADQRKLPQKSGEPIPLAACKLAILPAEGANQEIATLSIQIFIWKSKGPFNRELFESADDWLINDKWFADSLESLTMVMEYLTRDDPLAVAMREEMKECFGKMKASRPYSDTMLMKWLQAGERPDAPQPPGLTVQLHPYQRQSLRFMLDNESGEGGHRRHFWVPYKTPSGFTVWWSPIFKRACRVVAPSPWGGFLAEEMGCGKTVEVLALILANPAPPETVSGTSTSDGYIQSRATLVVCAVSLVGQWMEEAKSKLNGSLHMYQYHGQGRIRDPKRLAVDYDLVVTTYQTLGSDWRMYTKKGGNTDGRFQPLGQIKWHRVILDESHTVKAGGAQQSMACCALKGDRRWCCSGTPISTEISEFMGQFNFLGCPPFSTKNFFQYHVKPTWTTGAYNLTDGAVCLLYALRRTLIRHTQQQRLGGKTVCELPKKTEESIAVNFSEAEQGLYLRVHNEAKAEFHRYVSRGAHYVAKHLLSIMSLLSPLRAICSGGVLRDKDVKVPSLDEEQEVPVGVDPNLVAPSEECSICLNLDMERPCRTPCMHWFCRECITAELTVRDKCPLCRQQISAAELTEGVSVSRGEDDQLDAGVSSSSTTTAVASESKLRMLLDELAKMREGDPSAKALIFTQFNATLEWLMARLTQEGYGYRTISGSMPLKKRSQAIEAFQRDPPTTVFLLSMRSGAVGINLTAANHVFILEPAMNPVLEDQAVGRAFRMGQTRPVIVKKLYIKGSVEERIMELVNDRREGKVTGGVGPQARVRQQDVAGSINTDRQNLRMAELQLLFQDPFKPSTAGLVQAAAAYDAAPAPAACGGSS